MVRMGQRWECEEMVCVIGKDFKTVSTRGDFGGF